MIPEALFFFSCYIHTSVTERGGGTQRYKLRKRQTHTERQKGTERVAETEMTREGQRERNTKYKYAYTLSESFVYSCVSMTKIRAKI